MRDSVWAVLERMAHEDATAPRLTFYERAPGATRGERIELSAKVLINWVSKAANLLTEEFDVEPGTRVGVFLPATHWRTAYWCLAAWTLGANVALVDSDAEGANAPVDGDVLLTSVPVPGFVGDQVVVTLAMLARSAMAEVPVGVLDEAKELSTFGDVFSPLDEPSGDDVALAVGDTTMTYDELVVDGRGGRVYHANANPTELLRTWSAGGSVVIVRGPIDDDELDRILQQESAERA